MTSQSRLRHIRILLVVVVVGLVVSGLTAFPLELETRYLLRLLQPLAPRVPALVDWVRRVHDGLADTGRQYPFMAYGTDWLAFAHIVIAIAFIGPLRDPVRNAWVVTFGLIACAAVVPLALIAGAIRGIPLYWRLIDCSFGVGGALLLWPCRRAIQELETLGVASVRRNAA